MPPPGWLQAYENVLAGSADRMLSMVEKEQDHRHTIARRGQAFASALTVLGMVAATVLLYFDKPLASVAPILTALLPFIMKLLEGRGQQPTSPTTHAPESPSAKK